MAKELPYFKFEPSEWIAKDIQNCSLESRGAFIDICALYWIRLGSLDYATALRRVCQGNTRLIQELIEFKVIKVNDDQITINFLDEQLESFKEIGRKNSENAAKRWKKEKSNAVALPSDSERNAIREDKIRVEKIKEEIPAFDEFKSYALTHKPKVNLSDLELKYKAWIEAGWMCGKPLKKIKNWKTTLLNTLPYLKEDSTTNHLSRYGL